MKITVLNTGGLDLLPIGGPERFPGVHVGDVIRDISNKVLKPGQRQKYDQLSPNEKIRMGNYTAMGWAWEALVKKGLIAAGLDPAFHFPDRFTTPGELMLDGLAGNPDWLDLQLWENVELKATWRSSTRPLDTDFWEWMCQFKAYCKMLTTTSTRLLVFWVNGDYRDSGPQFWDVRIQFAPIEIRDNWSMIRRHGGIPEGDKH